jgi:hypothetical protein
MKCTWHQPAKQLYQPMISSSPVTTSNSQKPAHVWKKIKKCCLPFTTSQLHIGLIYGPPTPSNPPLLPFDYELNEPKGCGSRIATLNHGLQTWSGSPKALAPPPRLRTNPKSSYRRTLRRRRKTSPNKHFNQSFQQGCARSRNTTFDNTSVWTLKKRKTSTARKTQSQSLREITHSLKGIPLKENSRAY